MWCATPSPFVTSQPPVFFTQTRKLQVEALQETEPAAVFDAVQKIYEIFMTDMTGIKLKNFGSQEVLTQYLASAVCAFSAESDPAPFDFGLIFKGRFVTDIVRRACLSWVADKLTSSTHFQRALGMVCQFLFVVVCVASLSTTVC
jgi:hypothetical protein